MVNVSVDTEIAVQHIDLNLFDPMPLNIKREFKLSTF